MRAKLKKGAVSTLILVILFATALVLPKGKTADIAKAAEITLHFKWLGEEVPHIYYSNVNGDGKTPVSWPGIPMKAEENDWYSYTIPEADTADIIVDVAEQNYQTSSFSRESGEWWFDQQYWYTENPDGTTQSVQADNDRVIQVSKQDPVVVNADNSIIVHFCSDWDKANIYYWNALPDNQEVAWPGKSMDKDKNGYYTYTFANVSKINLLFHDGTQQTEDLTRNETGEWWYKNGTWYDKDPSGIDTTPTATATTTGGGSNSTPAPFERTDFRDETIYFLMTTRFYDGDSGNNVHCSDENAKTADSDPAWRGDFKGLIEKLDYIKALGFSAIWITPVVENKSGLDYHGYHAYNFSKVDSRYESDGVDYQKLINACHEKGMKVIQDVVFNHTCNWGEVNLKILESDVYTDRNKIIMPEGKGDDPDNPIYHHNGFCGSNDYDEYTAQNKTIADDCFDLETENPTVYNYLVDCYKKYINMGVDGFRVDTVKHMSRLTLNSVFVPEFKKTGGDNFFMFGEVCTKGHDVWYRDHPPISTCFYTWKEEGNWANCWTDSWSKNESLVEQHYKDHLDKSSQPTSDNAFLNGNEYHTPDYSKSSGLGVIDFQMHWSFENAGNAYGQALGGDKYFNDSTWNVVYVDSHDYGPDGKMDVRYTGGTDAWAENLDLMFTFRGIPCIYYGSEIEFQKGKPIDKGHDAALADTGRAYFGEHIEGSVNTTDYGVYSDATGAMAETLNSTLSKHLQRLNLIRRAVPALRKGQYSTKDCNGSMAYKRRYTDSKTDSFACVTISGDATFSGVPTGTYVELITGEKVQCDGTLTAKCSGRGNMRVYVLQTDGAPNGKIGEDGAYLK